jgi:YidC/Oxa1 family membrane protein insertase
VDPFNFPPIAAAVDALAAAVRWFSHLVAPWAGASAGAIAIVALTLLVRAALIPVGRSQARAEADRRRIAPQLKRTQERYRRDPQVLQRKTMELYRAEGVSMFGGLGPAVLQIPVVSLVYGLFVRPEIHGAANALLAQHLFGAPLGATLLSVAWPQGLAIIGLLAVIAAIALVNRRANLRAAPLEGRAATVLSWMPLVTVLFAAIVPLAATLYLAVTTAWTSVERALWRRRYRLR